MDSNGFNNGFDNEQTNRGDDFFSNESFETPVPDKGAVFAEKIRKIFASSAFLTATVAFTVMAGASFIWGNFDVFSILFTIGMWLAYTSASKSMFPLKDLKFLSGVVKAYYIVAIVGIVGLVLSGITLIFTGPTIMESENEIINIIRNIDQTVAFDWSSVVVDEEVPFSTLEGFLNYISTTLEMNISTFLGMFMVILGVILIISAVISILINEFFIHKLGKQMKKAVAALTLGTDAELKLGGVRVWFIVIGVFSAISTLSILATFDLIMVASQGASAVACFAIASAIKEKENTQDTVQPML